MAPELDQLVSPPCLAVFKHNKPAPRKQSVTPVSRACDVILSSTSKQVCAAVTAQDTPQLDLTQAVQYMQQNEIVKSLM